MALYNLFIAILIFICGMAFGTLRILSKAQSNMGYEGSIYDFMLDMAEKKAKIILTWNN